MNVLGSSVVVPKFQIYVNGVTVNSPDKAVALVTNNPTFFGYAYSNVNLNFILQSSKPFKLSTTTDNTGYWVFSLTKPLQKGTYKLYYSVNDGREVSSSAKLAATFKVPAGGSDTLGAIAIPKPSLKKLDYLTVSILVTGLVLTLVFVYLLAKKHKHVVE
jgi:hypothetical protein